VDAEAKEESRVLSSQGRCYQGYVCLPFDLTVIGITYVARSIVINASISPLLQLPLEIRNKIWRKVLGNRLIHVKYRRDDKFRSQNTQSPHRTCKSHQDSCKIAWRHIVCEYDCPENQRDESMMISPTGRKDILWIGPHSSCKLHYDPCDYKPSIGSSAGFRDHKTMHLTALRASRQIYVEANQVLWSSNTFSFADGVTLKRFMETRNIHQKRLIHNLRLFIDWQYNHVKDWNSSLNMTSIRALSGLRNLRLHIVYSLEARACRLNHTLYDLLDNTFYFEGLWRLSTLPLSGVEVAVRNPPFDSKGDLWDQDELEEVVDSLKTMLLNPEGAVMYAMAQPELKRTRSRIRAGSDLESGEETKASCSHVHSTMRLLAVTTIRN